MAELLATINSSCFTDDGAYYDCDKCNCLLTDNDMYLNLFLSFFSGIAASILVVAYFFIKELREKPGDLIFAISLWQFIFAVCWFIMMIKGFYVNPPGKLNVADEFCDTIALITFTAKILFGTYNIAMFVYIVNSLRNPLKGASSSTLPYHIGAILFSIGDDIFRIESDGLGMNMYGGCSDKTNKSPLIPIGYLTVFIVGPLVTRYFTSKSLPKSNKVRTMREDFLRYYNIYLFLISFLYIGLYVNQIILVAYADEFNDEFTHNNVHGTLRIFRDVGYVFRTANPFILTYIRLNDPMIKRNWNKIFWFCKKKRGGSKKKSIFSRLGIFDNRTQNLLSEEENKNDMSIENINPNEEKSEEHFIEEFKKTLKVQLVYSILSSIHYYWRRKTNDNEDVLNSSRLISSDNERFDISDNALRTKIPDVMSEVKDQRYFVPEAIFTVWHPTVFNQMIEQEGRLDEIIASLNLQKNFKKIQASGVNGGGKSGEFFFFSSDNKFIIKTLNDTELRILIDVMPKFKQYYDANPFSLITKIYGVFTFETKEPYEKYNLMLMRNINGYPSKCIQRLFDLKGSTISRKSVRETNLTKTELKSKGVLKDLDFENYEDGVLKINEDLKPFLAQTLKKDSDFLCSLGLMDYSLIVFVIDKRQLGEDDPDPSQFNVLTNINASSLSPDEQVILEKYRETHEGAPNYSFNPFFSMKSTEEEVYYHIGLVDYLDSFGWTRRAEMYWKRISKCNWKLDTSVQPPTPYSVRFKKYADKICAPDGKQVSIFDLQKMSNSQYKKVSISRPKDDEEEEEIITVSK